MSGGPGAGGGAANAVRRINRELKEINQNPSKFWTAEPANDDLFEWHFTLKGPAGTEFERGIYHGRIVLPLNYPFAPPHIMLLTPNGRFEINKKICLSISSYHPETWQPAWGLRTMIEALRSFFPSPAEGALGALNYTPETRRQIAEKESRQWRCSVCERTNEELLPLCDEVVEEDDKPDATAKVAEPPVEQAPATTTGTTTTSTTQQQQEPPADAPRHASTPDHSPQEKAASTSDAKKPPKSEESIKNSDPQQQQQQQQQQQSATSTASSTASSSADEQNTSKRKSAFASAEEQDRPSPASAAAITGGDVSVRAGEREDNIGTSTQHQATTRRPEKGVSPSSKNTAALLRAAGVSSDRTAVPPSSPVQRECDGAVNTFGSSSSTGATATASAPSAGASRSGTTPSPTAKKKLRKPVPYYKRKIDLPTIASSKNYDYAVQEFSGGDSSQDSDTPLTEEKIEEIVKQQRAFVNKMREDQRKEEEERKERKAAKAKARAAAASCGAGSSGASTKNKGGAGEAEHLARAAAGLIAAPDAGRDNWRLCLRRMLHELPVLQTLPRLAGGIGDRL
eukprot:CAMPEP_0179002294 /NCGR_PEP_ID=MMETSP0795-20121207/11913_1 /TAXON_ID=88552 /ORGANISM="Amoebophrya sp., Strain Ameob2" /LENGTH=568 /DNA_ID=CAMNT_0020695917 /DNA_START=78 /DNA_END=1783 /DNA_ORIENTATION=+